MRLYRRGLYCSLFLMEYWRHFDLPMSNLMMENPTIFSEETGELGLSILVQSLPRNHDGDYEQTRRHWQQAKLRGEETRSQKTDFKLNPANKRYRMISTSLILMTTRNICLLVRQNYRFFSSVGGHKVSKNIWCPKFQ